MKKYLPEYVQTFEEMKWVNNDLICEEQSYTARFIEME